MAKVAIDIRLIGKNRTGDETVFFELTKKLLDHHPEHQYVLLSDRKEEDREKLWTVLGLIDRELPVEIIFFGPQNSFWWNLVTIPFFFLRRKDIQVFHTQYILPFWLPAHLQVVAHIHDISFARYPRYIGFKDLFFLRLFIPRTMKRAHIVAPSLFTKTEIETVYKVPGENITVVPNAPSEDFGETLVPNNSTREEIRNKYHLPKYYFLYVGTLQPRKNIPYLLAMFAQYKKEKKDDMKLVLVGNTQAHHFDQGITKSIRELGLEQEVLFPGYIEKEDLPMVYQGATAFVFPSLYEGFGIPILEALVNGLPTFASDIEVHREIGGENVTYFPLHNIAKATKILYTTPITEHTPGVRNNIPYSWPYSCPYSWARSAHIVAALYQQLVNKH